MEHWNHFRSTREVFSNQANFSVHPPSDRIAARWAQAYLGLAGALSLVYIQLFAHRRTPWPLGDWLINYEGGFLRRGLCGQLVLLGHRFLHVPLVAGAACLEAACIVCLVACLWSLVPRCLEPKSPIWLRALLFSPATLAFVWLDPGLAFRKEIALFALFGLVIQLLRRTPPVSDAALAAMLTLACPLLLLSHEGLICYLPYVAATVVLRRDSVARGLRICAVPCIVGLLTVAFAVRHPGDQAAANLICNSVGGGATGLCTGPIWYMGLSLAVYRGEVADLTHDRRMMLVFAVTAVLALLPAMAGLVDLWRRPISRKTRPAPALAFALASLASTVLFVQAQDWSRWIYIHAFCLFLMLLSAVDQRDRTVQTVAPTRLPKWRAQAWSIVLLILYATTWRLPEWIIRGAHEYSPFGYSSLLYRAERHAGGGLHVQAP